MTTPLLVKDAMHPRAVTLSPHSTLADAVVTMQELRVKRLPVVQEGRLVGIVTDGEVRRALPTLTEGLTPWAFVDRVSRVRARDIMRQPVLTVTPDTTVQAALRLMLDRRVGGLPVVDGDGALRGMLTLTDILRAESRAARLHWGAVEQHMTRDVVTVTPTTPASEAAATLKVTRLHVLPVVQDNQLRGVLHASDLSDAVDRAAATHGPTVMADQFFLTGLSAADLMRPPTGYLTESVPMRDALTRMLDLDVHGLPVITEDGDLLGVVTISDVIRTVLGDSVSAGSVTA